MTLVSIAEARAMWKNVCTHVQPTKVVAVLIIQACARWYLVAC